jgi:hypothetical protein
MEMSKDNADQLLRAAAVFVYADKGSSGFLDRFTTSFGASPPGAGYALDQALSARQRAGRTRFAISAGHIRTERTSSGASLTACLLPTHDGVFTASVQITDIDNAGVAGLALRVIDMNEHVVLVTDGAGRAQRPATGQSVFVELGDYRSAGVPGQTAMATVIPVRPPQERSRLALAAADNEHPAQLTSGSTQPLIEIAGVAFWCLNREGGRDLTLLIEGSQAELDAGGGRGIPGVQFVTWASRGFERRWIVPMSPSPLGLSGSLYGTEEDWLDPGSVQVRTVDEFVSDLGDEIDDVVHRSVGHAHGHQEWRALGERMEPSRERTAVETALASRDATP